jgi:hypothetical protein
MEPRDTTLAHLCKPTQEQFKSSGHAAEFMNAQRPKLKITTVAWDMVEEKIAEKIVGVFDIKLLDIWLAAWKKCRELQRFADREKYPPEEEIPVPLTEHEIVSEHHPKLEIEIAGTVEYNITFDLVARLKITGCRLTIQGGRIKKVLVAECQGEASLEYDKLLLLKTETESVPLGKEIDLGEGIPLSSSVAESPVSTAASSEMHEKRGDQAHEEHPTRPRPSESHTGRKSKGA